MPQGKRFDLGDTYQYDASKVEKRVVKEDAERGEYPRLELYGDLNDVLGDGLPYGLTTLYGTAGSGKSKFAKHLAEYVATNYDPPVVYAAAEAITDIPEHDNVVGLDYTENKPKYTQATDEVLGFCNDKQPRLLVIDSATKMFSKTDKAVEEADVRSALDKLQRRAESNMSVVVTSEVRGNPGWEYPAGGQAVAHACALLIRMHRREATNLKEARELGENVGSIVWTLSVEKDRENKADSSRQFKPVYTRRGVNLEAWEMSADSDGEDDKLDEVLEKLTDVLDGMTDE